MPDPYASFLVRLWREAGAAAGWQGEVEDIQSGRRWAFGSLDETLDFLRRAIDLHDGPNTGPDDVPRE